MSSSFLWDFKSKNWNSSIFDFTDTGDCKLLLKITELVLQNHYEIFIDRDDKLYRYCNSNNSNSNNSFKLKVKDIEIIFRDDSLYCFTTLQKYISVIETLDFQSEFLINLYDKIEQHLEKIIKYQSPLKTLTEKNIRKLDTIKIVEINFTNIELLIELKQLIQIYFWSNDCSIGVSNNSNSNSISQVLKQQVNRNGMNDSLNSSIFQSSIGITTHDTYSVTEDDDNHSISSVLSSSLTTQQTIKLDSLVNSPSINQLSQELFNDTLELSRRILGLIESIESPDDLNRFTISNQYMVAQDILVMLIQTSKDYSYQIQSTCYEKFNEIITVSNQINQISMKIFPSLGSALENDGSLLPPLPTLPLLCIENSPFPSSPTYSGIGLENNSTSFPIVGFVKALCNRIEDLIKIISSSTPLSSSSSSITSCSISNSNFIICTDQVFNTAANSNLAHSYSTDSPLNVRLKHQNQQQSSSVSSSPPYPYISHSPQISLIQQSHFNHLTRQTNNSTGSIQYHPNGLIPTHRKNNSITGSSSVSTASSPTGSGFNFSPIVQSCKNPTISIQDSSQESTPTFSNSSLLDTPTLESDLNRIMKSKSDSMISICAVREGDFQISHSIFHFLQIYPEYTQDEFDQTIWTEEEIENVNVVYKTEEFKSTITSGNGTISRAGSSNLSPLPVPLSIHTKSSSSFSLTGSSSTTSASTLPDKSIKYGTLNQLIIKLTNESNSELKFTKTFITTYRSFTTGEIFLMKLIQRYFIPNLKPHLIPALQFKTKFQNPIQLRVLNVLRLWVDNYIGDFTPKMVQRVSTFLSKTSHGQYSQMIVKRFSQPRSRADSISQGSSPLLQVPNITNNSSTGNGSTTPTTIVSTSFKIFWKKYSSEYIFSLHSREIADQLTLLDFDTYRSIRDFELLNQAWSRPEVSTPNVNAMVNRFNSMSAFVSWAILNEIDIKLRAKMLSKMIKICSALKQRNNFNGLIACLSGLTVSSVFRLVHTRSLISKDSQKEFEQLSKFLEAHKSHKYYREIIHTTSPPLIPYLGVYLTDLTFIEDGNKDEINGLINIKKRELTYSTILEIQQYQQQSYDIKPNRKLIDFLNELPQIIDKKAFEDKLYEQSLKIEPKNITLKEVLQKCGYKK
ncbi:Ras guanine nucleotide exchange factor [Tieghemostelium lacteum]|uniref:Ras guanine nucleotide exchange factor n=1 Tax=Tieghemostelium lacteum TaxID=361077 RepID=A0A151ZFT2_TIELA|nr:Ras guanine nucleotide exchange factor [Tieghemostelium lacteum]|eukprot:KYQ92724.1 Ras guanine nucleotide exchange factor [Tieghemostelium lacteum]